VGVTVSVQRVTNRLRVFNYNSRVTGESLPHHEQFAIAKSGLTFSVDVAQSHLFPA